MREWRPSSYFGFPRGLVLVVNPISISFRIASGRVNCSRSYNFTKPGGILSEARGLTVMNPGQRWSAAARKLKDAMLGAGISEAIVDRLLAALARPFAAALERGAVDDDLLWALAAVQGEIFRRAEIGSP
jgi:hypothetical protein